MRKSNINDKNSNANKILKLALENNVSTLKDIQAKNKLIEYIQTVIIPENDNLSYSVSVNDLDKLPWRRNEHFMKVFWFEIDHLEEYYSLSRGSKQFLLELGRFLMWETNLLVDDENEPLNQKLIAQKLGVHVTTVRRNMNELIDKYVIHPIDVWNKTYYIMNPYVMFIGQNINKTIPKLFDDLGYVNSNDINKNGRTNRSKNKKSLNTVGLSDV